MGRRRQSKLACRSFDWMVLAVVREEMSHLLMGEMHDCPDGRRTAAVHRFRDHKEIIRGATDTRDFVFVRYRCAVDAKVVAHDTHWPLVVLLSRDLFSAIQVSPNRVHQ
jgi:hypothetical protein